MGTLAQAVRSGKALYVGLSNYDGPTLKAAAALLDEMRVPFIINQNRCNMLDRAIDRNGLRAACSELRKGIICFSPLAQGMLTERYLDGIPDDCRIRTDGRFLKESQVSEHIASIRALKAIADKRGQTLAEMALAWLLKDDTVTSVLIGASRPAQILDNIRAAENTDFTADELAEIDRLTC